MIGFSLNPINWVTSAAGAVLGPAGAMVIDAIVGWIEGGLAYIAGEVAMRLSDVSAGSFDETALELAGRAKWVALVLVVGSMFVSAAGAVLSRDGSIGDTVKEIPLTLAFLAMWWVAATTVATALSHLTAWFLSDALLDAMRSGLVIAPSVNSFVRAAIAALMVIFLLIFYVELLVLNHMVTIGVIVGQVAIGLRPSRGTRGVSGQMVRNLAALAAGPPLATLSLALTMGNAAESAEESLLPSLTALAGLVVSVLAPLLAARFLPFGGDGGNPARALIGAGVQIAGYAAGGAVAGGVMAAHGGAGLAPGGGQAAHVISGPGPGAGGGAGAPAEPPSGGGGSGGGVLPGAPRGQAASAPVAAASGGGGGANRSSSPASMVTSTPAGRPPPAARVDAEPPAAARPAAGSRQRAAAASAAVADLVRVGDEQ